MKIHTRIPTKKFPQWSFNNAAAASVLATLISLGSGWVGPGVSGWDRVGLGGFGWVRVGLARWLPGPHHDHSTSLHDPQGFGSCITILLGSHCGLTGANRHVSGINTEGRGSGKDTLPPTPTQPPTHPAVLPDFMQSAQS